MFMCLCSRKILYGGVYSKVKEDVNNKTIFCEENQD